MNQTRWIAALIAVLAVCMIFRPFGLVILAPALIVGGIVARRQTQDPRLRAVGAGAVAAGMTGVLLVVLFIGTLLFFMPARMDGPSGGVRSMATPIIKYEAPVTE